MLLFNRLFCKNILIFYLSLLGFTNSYAQTISFKHLTVEDGLSHNRVNAVIQDKNGFIWFGTEDGLSRYDGYGFKIYRHDTEDSNSISDNSIWALLEDKNGNIWIGTKAGVVNRFNPVSENFTHWKIISAVTQENSIKAIFEDTDGNIWIGTYKEGLYKLDLSTNKFDHWGANKNDKKSLSHNYVQDITEDNNGNIIVATYIGLNKLNPDLPQNGFERFYHNPNNQNSLSSNLIWRLKNSSFDSSMIWIGTNNHLTKFHTNDYTLERFEIANPENLQYGTSVNSVVEQIMDTEEILWAASYSGLTRINISKGTIFRFVHNENEPTSLISNQINKIIKDRSGVLWIVTENGISYSTPKSTLFNTLVLGDTDLNVISSLNKKNITSISESDVGRVWIGTSDGLYLIDDIENKLKMRKLSEFEGHHIWSLTNEDENKIWIGTYGKGLKLFDSRNNKTTNWDVRDSKMQTESVYYNRSLLADSKKNIWVGYWGVGTARINPQTGNADVWQNEPGNTKSLSHNDVWVIKEDRSGRIWIGTQGGGLNLFEDNDGGIFHHWLHIENGKSGLGSNNINAIYEASNSANTTDLKTTLWIGTSNGLNKVVVEMQSISKPYDIDLTFHSYTIKDGLSSNNVNSILEDKEGNLWLGTGDGISFFNRQKETFTNFSSADGLNGTVMNPKSALKLKNGLMIFGSTKGLNIFDPAKIKSSAYKPSLLITDFQIFNKSINISNNSPLRQNILYTKELTLEYNQDVFSFEFSALDFNSPQSIRYAYKMEGFDEDWIESGNRRYATYTNLDPGTYLFNVKATNSDGVWNSEQASLKVIISPPWWATLWAYGLYTMLIILGLLAIRRFEMNRTKLRNELRLREHEAKQKSKLEELKSRFFANLSHEFRTPLTLIKGPVELLKNSISDSLRYEQISIIERNSEKLKELIDQLLELSQLENSSVPLRARKEDVIGVLKGLVFSFDSLAGQKNILIEFESDSDIKTGWIDNDKFEKIINNLLSNALKFTPDGGKVRVIVKNISSDGKDFVEIIISDTGIGIPEHKLENIFDRFYQADDSSQRSYGGSGIGLALVKELVELHKWDINVESGEGKGAAFKLIIPLSDDYLNDSEKVSGESINDLLTENQNKSSANHFHSLMEGLSTGATNRVSQENKSSILIVEDSADLRKYLSALLQNDYVISEAANGEEGIKTANEILPDLIISDVMMPSMDGMQFCKRIKSEWKTSDIPIILLTAKASFESKLEGLETGADDYLTKPFDSRELFVRINNLLEQRKRIRDKYSKELSPLPEINKLEPADNNLIRRAYEIVLMNLDKTNFSTDQLSKELFLSRSQLHRKFSEITGHAPGEFIRTIKLKHAARMLLEKNLSVTQIAYAIGFSSPAQFSRAFSKHYNCTPSEYSSNQNI